MKQILILSDLHGEHEDRSVVAHAAEHFDPHYIILNGDIIDGEEASPWGGWYPHLRLVDEHNNAVDRIQDLIDTFPRLERIAVNAGNHGPARVKRTAKHDGASRLYGPPDVLSIICDGVKMIYKANESGGKSWQPEKTNDWGDMVSYQPGLNSWVTEVGTNCIVCHAHASSITFDGMAERWMFRKILTRYSKARLVVQGHTHRVGYIRKGDYAYMETGCSCHAMEYGDGPRGGWPAMHNGYAVLAYDEVNHKVKIEESRLIDLGPATDFKPVRHF